MFEKLILGANRREFLVCLGGVSLGTFLLPGWFTDKAHEGQGEEQFEYDLLIRPTWGKNEDRPYLLMVENDGTVKVWMAETPGRNSPEFLEMKRFYEATCNVGCPEVDPREVFPIEREQEETHLLRGIMLTQDEDSVDAELAYAKWLKERGDVLGEFIEADILTEDLPGTDPRWDALAARYAELTDECYERVYRPLASLGLWPTTGSDYTPVSWAPYGVVTSVSVTMPGVLPEKTDLLFQAAPALVDIEVAFEGWDVPAIVARRELNQITKLKFTELLDTSLCPDDMHAIAQSRHFGRLHTLDVSSNPIGEGIVSLLNSPLARQLQTFDFHSCKLTENQLSQLFASEAFENLKSLHAGSNAITPDAMEVFARNRGFRRIKSLDLSSSPMGSDGLQILAGGDFEALKELVLDLCELDQRCAAILAGWPQLQNLLTLSISNADIGDEGVRQLTASGRLGQVQHLNLSSTSLTCYGARLLSQCENLCELEELYLSGNDIRSEGASALAASPHLSNLTMLQVPSTLQRDEGGDRLINAFGDEVVQFS